MAVPYIRVTVTIPTYVIVVELIKRSHNKTAFIVAKLNSLVIRTFLSVNMFKNKVDTYLRRAGYK